MPATQKIAQTHTCKERWIAETRFGQTVGWLVVCETGGEVLQAIRVPA